MSKPVIFCIGGKARNGKDTSATFFKEKYSKLGKKVLHINFGNYVKYIATNYFGWNGEKDEVGRTILQQVGTEIVRQKNPNFWVDNVIEFLKVFDDYDYVFIPDCRFPNEVTRFIEEGYEVVSIYVTRTNFENNLTEEQKKHPSETAMDDFPFEYYIEAEDLKQLEDSVDAIMENLNDGK